MTRLGADATAETIAALKALGVTFIGRYASDYPEKNLTLPEAQRISNAGIDLVTNWENDVDDWRGGYAQGVTYAKRALAQHTACGGPTGNSERWGIYPSIDQQVDPDDPTLHDYFHGWNAVLSPLHTGAYAQTSVLRTLRSLGLIGCGDRGGTWRSMSTFNLPEGLGLPGEFDIEQTGQFSPSYDRNIANSGNFGQWRIGASAPLYSTPEVTMQDEIWAVAKGPAGEDAGIWLRTSDGQYGHVQDIATRDALISLLGVQEKTVPYSVHQLFLAMSAKSALTVDAAALGAVIAANVKLPSTLTITGTETVAETGKLT